MDSLDRIESKVDKLAVESNAHETKIARIEDRLASHSIILSGADGQSGLVGGQGKLMEFRSNSKLLAAVAGALWALLTVLAGSYYTSYLDAQAKMRETQRQAETISYLKNLGVTTPTPTHP